MPRRLRRWVIIGLLAAVGGVVAVAASRPPYLPVIHGSADAEVARMIAWLRIEPGTRVADVSAGEGTFAPAPLAHAHLGHAGISARSLISSAPAAD